MKRRPKIDKSALRFGETVRTREPAYIAWLHTQPCVVSGQRGDVVVHHPMGDHTGAEGQGTEVFRPFRREFAGPLPHQRRR